MTINVDPTKLISVSEAAAMMEISERAVRKKILYGHIPAVKIGTQWIMQRGAVKFHMATMKYKKKGK